MNMPISLPSDALQKALHGLLTRQMTTKTPVYDYVAKGTAFPYVTFGRIITKPSGTKTEDISTCLVDFDIFSKYRGRSEINGIAQDITNTLTIYKVKMSESGFAVLSKEYINLETNPVSDIDGYAGILTFQFRIQNTKGAEKPKNETKTP